MIAQDGPEAPELCRKHGISDATFYNWRSKYGGMEVSDAKRVKALDEENHKLKISFWSLNIGLAMMTVLSLLPQGILQTYISIEKGYSFARSAEFIHSPIMQALFRARVPGDVVFSAGVFAFVWFVFRAFVPKEAVRNLPFSNPVR